MAVTAKRRPPSTKGETSRSAILMTTKVTPHRATTRSASATSRGRKATPFVAPGRRDAGARRSEIAQDEVAVAGHALTRRGGVERQKSRLPDHLVALLRHGQTAAPVRRGDHRGNAPRAPPPSP